MHPEEDIPITAVIGVAPACILAVTQYLGARNRTRHTISLAVGLNLFAAMFWVIVLGWVLSMQFHETVASGDVALLAVLSFSILSAGWNWLILRRVEAQSS